MKKLWICLGALILVIVLFLAVYPFIEIDTGEKLIRCSYSGDFSQYDVNHSYNEVYCYNEKHDVSIRGFTVKKCLFFYTIHMEYVPGDVRQTQFMLEESYITHFLENALITDNPEHIDLAALIADKQAIVGNTRYTTDEEKTELYYELNGEYGEMYLFYSEDLLVIQVGSPDENPKYIAYKDK